MKRIETDWRGNVKLYVESFENYKEFYDILMERQSRAKHDLDYILRDNGTSWTGINSVKEAKDLFLNGWEKPIEDLKVKIDKELQSIEKTARNRMSANVCGFIPIIPNALKKLPYSMLDTKVEKRKSKVLKFMISISRTCSTSADAIINKLSKQLAYIASLERSGKYRCRIEIMFPAFGGLYENGQKYSTAMTMLVKSENQLFDVRRLSYPIIHPSMLRLLAFGWYYSLPLNYDDYRVGGMGTAFPKWGSESKEKFLNKLLNANEKTFVIDYDTDVEQMLRKGGY